MKKILLFVFALATIQFAQAQVDFGIKAGINYNSDSFKLKDIQSDVFKSETKGKLGYHAGIWTRLNIPVVGLYIRPELVYTALKSEITLKNTTTSLNSVAIKADYDFQKIDVPVLVGKKFLKVVHAYAGPSFQYIINSVFGWDQVKEIKADSFTVGLQLGAGVEFSGLGIDVRWERGFSDTESELIGKNANEKIKFDTRVNQIIVGLSYKF